MANESFLYKIDRIAKKNSKKTAISDRYGDFSFEYILNQSNNIACNLNSRGIGKGDFVAIYMETSANWVIAMLGIVKSGAAYIPLDPCYPKKRIEFCLRDSDAKAVIVNDNSHNEIIKKSISIEELLTSNDMSSYPERDFNTPSYMIYTSGSTGNPKGVIVPFSAINHHMNWFINSFDFSENDIFLQKTSTSFDASIWEYLAPLMLGCKMVISGPSPDEVYNSVLKNNITILQLVPTVLEFMIDNYDFGKIKCLNKLFCGGEPLPVRLADSVHATLPIPIINLYGPTEVTVQCAYFIYNKGDNIKEMFLPIGQPIPMVKFEMENIDSGIGELIIEGPSVSIGYHGQNEKTEESFSFNEKTGYRTYKSGDLVTIKDDGNYYFIGRGDNQVKLRGLRIDLSEIEEIIKIQNKSISSSVVLINENEQMVAYLTSSGEIISISELANSLHQHLPEYMIPAIFTQLDYLPRLPNGKIDRKRLIETSGKIDNEIDSPSTPSNSITHGNFTSQELPSSNVKKFIYSQWENVLSKKPIENSHFFLSGGHSLSAIKLIMNINKEFGTKLPTVALLISPRIDDFIERVEKEVSSSQ
ncbi:non-ribosomal peptide synthetase [Serratia fonticola]|uniref:Non-ribosomal peptide synthetase n=1 Tax=Serratia fonticola TaxID=47917 RepID=A0AAW3WQG2_SERFO|nr:non-ribosomal peptide synthetase [Serratia fonticola]MBC3212438.1 non-ribosomal peptide synthetase [Serratia fonticola]NYA12976.1 non-ribosomal peptide synthetase [Serratia fonticola]NYA32554.1 non-ribosomal peptide synthetase [Serratia fonticola]